MAGERTKLIVQTSASISARARRAACGARASSRASSTAAASRSRSPIEERELRRALTGAAGLHSILDVEIDGTGSSHASILKDYQVDKVRGGVTHVDLHEVRLDQPIHASVSVHLTGGDAAPGVKEGGVLSQPLREIQVEALPLEVPEHIDLDVSHMATGDTLRIGDIEVPEGVTLLDDPETVVATVTAPTREIEPEDEEVEGEEGEGEGARARRGRGRRRGACRAGGRRRATTEHDRGLASDAALAPPSGVVARPARRRPRQPGPRVRAQPPQRRLARRRRARAAARRHAGARSSPASSPRSGSTGTRSRC